MNTFFIDVSQISSWAASMRSEAGEMVQQYINLSLKNSANIVARAEAVEMPRGDTNDMVRTIRQVVTTESATIGPDPSLDYPLYVELGTKPHMPPVDAITAWANSRGINPWALAMSIKLHGTKPNDFVGRTFDDTYDAVGYEFETGMQQLAAKIASV